MEALPEDPVVARAEYTIGVGDTLSVQVFDQDRMSGRARVRPDGRITVGFFVTDMDAEGKTPKKLADDIAATLRAVLNSPTVTVLVEESSPQSILVQGEVGHPGMQVLPRDAGVALALAAAGGLTPFAKKERIFVIRPGPPQQRIQFSYKSLIQMTGRGPSFRLRPKDVIVVD